MPGLTLISSDHPHSTAPLLQTALQPSFPTRHSSTRLWQSSTLDIVATAYPAYPIQTVETPEYWVCFEGGLYGVPASQRRDLLLDWSERLLGPSGPSLPHSLLSTDGDFIVAALHKSTQDWTVFNDSMGRLPLYVHTPSSHICLTRTFDLFNRLPSPPSPDRLGAAQQLTFGYPLGKRTLREGVDRVEPGTIFLYDSASTTLRRHRITSYNFDAPRAHSHRSVSENAARLADRLDQDTKARADWSRGSTVLALSGGLDSRSIACSLQRTNCTFEASTFARPDGQNASDVRYAAKIADRFDFPQQTVPLPPRSTSHLRALLCTNGGLNAFNVCYMIPYLEAVAEEKGEDAHLFTGNGGALLRDLTPPHPHSSKNTLANKDDLLHTLFHDVSRKWLPPDTAAALVGLRPEDLTDSVHARLTTYPESSLDGLYLHFAFERLFKYSFEGEDRNRAYLWSSAPYHGLHFTQYALNCPGEQKEKYRLYRAFLRALSPKTVQIGYGNFYGFRMTSLQYTIYRLLRKGVRAVPSLRTWLNQRRGQASSSSPPELTSSLLQELLSSEDCTVLNREVGTHLVNRPETRTDLSIDNMLTVALALCPSSRSLLSRDIRKP